MEHPGFFARKGPFALSQIASDLGIELDDERADNVQISDVRPLDLAGQGHLSFLDNRKYLAKLEQTSSSACLISPSYANRAPSGVIALRTGQPYRAFAKALWLFYPDAGAPLIVPDAAGSDAEALVHPSAALEEGVIVEPGARVAREAQIGAGTRVAAGAVVGYRVAIGRNCFVGPNAVVSHALVGDRVVIHGGVQIGQDGFGFAMGPQGHLKVPQVGRVIIQDDVEIGANTTIDRGTLEDTIIGEGTKVDNLVQIAHNVVVGRHCIIVAQVGIAGSTKIGDFVAIGGQSAIAGHLTIGMGAQFAAASKVHKSVPPGAKYAGMPAKPLKMFARELAAIKRLAERGER